MTNEPESRDSGQDQHQSREFADVLALVEAEIKLAGLRVDSLDDRLLLPIRWFNRNVAWFGALLLVVAVALRVAIAARLNPTTLAVLAQSASVQQVIFQVVPLILPTVLIWSVCVSALWLSKSKSVWAVPTFVVINTSGLVASFFIAPAVVFLTTAGQAALFGLAFTYMWRAESALSLLQARLVKMRSQYKKTRLDLKHSNRASESLRKLERKREELLSRDDLTPADRFQLLELGNQCADLRTGLEQDRVKIKRRLDVLEQLGNRDRWTKSEADMTATRFYRNASRLSDWGQDTRSRKLVSTVIRTLFLFAIMAALGVTLFTGTIWLPAQEYVPVSGREFSGYTLTQTPAAETIMTDVRREVIVLPVKGIRTQYLCQEGSSATSQTLYQLWLAHGGRPSYPACRG